MIGKYWLVWLAGIYIVLNIAHALFLGKTVYGDGIFYYSWVRSLTVDRNLDFVNEFVHFRVVTPPTLDGTASNKYPFGAPLLWLPTFFAAHSIFRGDGYGLPYQLVTSLTSVLYTVIGLILLNRWLNIFSSRKVSRLCTIAIATTSNLLFYGSIDTVNSHAAAFFAAVFFVNVAWSSHKYRWRLTGAALGLLYLIRPQDLLYGLLLIPIISLPNLLPFLAGLSIPVGLNLTVTYFLNHSWINPYLQYGETFNFGSPHIQEVLSSVKNGLLLWTPVWIPGLLGLATDENQWRRLGVWMLITFAAQLYLISSWSTWGQGASYSGRMFVGLLPVCAWGLSQIIKKQSNLFYPTVGIILFSLINFTGILYFLSTN